MLWCAVAMENDRSVVRALSLSVSLSWSKHGCVCANLCSAKKKGTSASMEEQKKMLFLCKVFRKVIFSERWLSHLKFISITVFLDLAMKRWAYETIVWPLYRLILTKYKMRKNRNAVKFNLRTFLSVRLISDEKVKIIRTSLFGLLWTDWWDLSNTAPSRVT